MPGFLYHAGAPGTCTHLAPISVVPADPRVLAGTLPVATIADILTVTGCLFQIPVPPGTKPQPCVTVKLVPSTRIFIGGKAALLAAPGTGVCLPIEQIPQGVPMITTQVRAGSLT